MSKYKYRIKEAGGLFSPQCSIKEHDLWVNIQVPRTTLEQAQADIDKHSKSNPTGLSETIHEYNPNSKKQMLHD